MPPPAGTAGPPRPPGDPERTQNLRPPPPAAARRAPPSGPRAVAPPPAAAPPARAVTRALVALAILVLAGVALWALREAAGKGGAERRAEALAAELGSLQRQLAAAEDRAAAAERELGAARSGLGRAAAPQGHANLIELGPREETRAAGGGETEIELAAGAPPTVILVRLGERPVDPSVVLELRDARGLTVWREERVRRGRTDRLLVVLPAGSLPVGRYELVAAGLRAGQERPVGAWPLQVVSSH
jgi:hypothetical protein